MKYKCQVLFILTVIFISGCGLSFFGTDYPIALIDDSKQDLSLIDAHLILMKELKEADYHRQQELFTQVSSAHTEQISNRSRLRYALALLTSGHPNSDPGKGYTELKDVLQQPHGLSQHEVNLASVILNEAENSMILQAQNNELSNAVIESQEVKSKNGQDTRRIRQVRNQLEQARDEISSLQQQLQDANNKIEELKRIEVLSE